MGRGWREDSTDKHRGFASGAAGLLGWLAGLTLGFILGLGAASSARTSQPGAPKAVHARPARNPLEIPARGWRKILRRTVTEFNADQIPTVAAGVTFFGLLALFPALGAFVSLYGLFANLAGARRQIAALGGLLPSGAVSVLDAQIQFLARTNHGRLGLTFVASLLLSLWSSNAGIKALIGGLNIAYEQREHRGFIRLNLISLGFTIGAVLFAVAGIAAIAAVPDILRRLGLASLIAVSAVRWPVLLLAVIALLSLLYRYGPSRERARWRWVTPGSSLAAIGWIGMSLCFSWYVANFGHYNRTYGALGAVVGFLTWIWLSLIVVLLGAELNAEIESQTSTDTAHALDKSRR
jgi:membrane protein